MEKLGGRGLGTHFLMWGRLYIQRNSSTPLQHEPVCSFLASVRPSTCSTTKYHCFTKSALLKNLTPYIHPSIHPSITQPFSPVSVLPDSSLYGLSWCTTDGIQAVGEFVLFVVQEPSGVSQAPDLHSSVALWLQLLCYMVHVHQHACTTRTGNRGCSWANIL